MKVVYNRKVTRGAHAPEAPPGLCLATLFQTLAALNTCRVQSCLEFQ